MTAVRALIAEDEPLLAEGLKAELQRLWPELQVVAQAGDGTSALQATLQHAPALCFLDIRMPGLSGLQVAEALAEDWPTEGPPFPLLVFITAYDEYALRAFAAQAVDYLLKPVEPERLQRCVKRLQQLLAQRQAEPPAHALQAAMDQLRGLLGPAAAPAAPRLEVIQAGIGPTVHLVPVDEVIYFEAADKYVRVVTADKEHLIRMSLRELLPQLDPHRFWQVHRGTVVQARQVLTAKREDSGKVTLTLRGRPEAVTCSRLHAHLFKGM